MIADKLLDKFTSVTNEEKTKHLYTNEGMRDLYHSVRFI